jgi:hypothetical protein
MLIQTYHAMPMPRCAVALRSRFQNGTVVASHGRSMGCVNPTRPHCVNQMGKTQSKPLAARHGRGTAWARHGNGMVCVNYPYPARDVHFPAPQYVVCGQPGSTTFLQFISNGTILEGKHITCAELFSTISDKHF